MLRKLKETELDKYMDFAYTLALDQSKSSYPTYTDGIKTKEDFTQSAKDAFSREDEEILLFEEDGEVHGWIHYYVLKEDDYLKIQVFNVESGVERAIDEFISYVTEKYADCTVYFGLPKANQNAISHLQKSGFTKNEESLALYWGGNIKQYICVEQGQKVCRENVLFLFLRLFHELLCTNIIFQKADNIVRSMAIITFPFGNRAVWNSEIIAKFFTIHSGGFP